MKTATKETFEPKLKEDIKAELAALVSKIAFDFKHADRRLKEISEYCKAKKPK